MIVTAFAIRGQGWFVFDVDNRRRLAGPFKKPRGQGRNLALAINYDLRKLEASDEAGIKAVIEKHVAEYEKKFPGKKTKEATTP